MLEVLLLSRLQTENEYKGKLLEIYVSRVLKFLKTIGIIKDFWSNVSLKYGGDLDHVVQLHDGSFLHLEDMNFDTKYHYDERSSRIQQLPRKLRKARKLYGNKVLKTVLIITDCLTARYEWLNENNIEPIIIGMQITEPLDKGAFTTLCTCLVGMILSIIKETTPISWELLTQNLVGVIRNCRARLTGFFQITLKSDDIKWSKRELCTII